MPTNPSEPGRKPQGLWGRLFGLRRPAEPSESDVLPTFDVEPVKPASDPPSTSSTPSDCPAEDRATLSEGWLPEAETPSPSENVPENVTPLEAALLEEEGIQVAEPVSAVDAPVAVPQTCAVCGAPRADQLKYCLDCGWMFTDAAPVPVKSDRAAAVTAQGSVLGGRYALGELISRRGALARWWAKTVGDMSPRCVILVEGEPCPVSANPQSKGHEDHILLGETAPHDPDATGIDLDAPGSPTAWPSLDWERRILEKARHPSLPQVVEEFQHEGRRFLVEEVPAGQVLWDAWDDPAREASERYDWLAQIAEALSALHEAGAVIEGLRPDIVRVTEDGRAILFDLSDLLPLPVPTDAPIQATLYTAPELIFDPAHADARSDLYGFGAMIYALHLGRELTEMDFERQGVPKPFVMRFPDAHPGLARIIMKTCTRELHQRFPTEEAARTDPTGFQELIQALRTLGRVENYGRMEVAAWTTTGMVRTNNEDAYALLHTSASQQDDLADRLVVLLADGMGGYEAGEVASAMTLEIVRRHIVHDPLFAALTGDASASRDGFDIQACRNLFVRALRDANQQIYTLSRKPGSGKRGMGCTAEVVYLDGRRAVGAHVGDSRVYHYGRGKLTQLTRDQTLVNRLVELGQLTPEEAENHPRKNELQQAIGGQPDVEPQIYIAELRPGDWLVVCSDGLTNHVDGEVLAEMIQRADSAEMCCRRLVNLANLQGGTDNCTVVVVRIT